MKTTYYANFSANHGTSLSESIKGSNKNKVIAEVRKAAKEETLPGNTCRWAVFEETEEKGSILVAEGRIERDGKSHTEIY